MAPRRRGRTGAGRDRSRRPVDAGSHSKAGASRGLDTATLLHGQIALLEAGDAAGLAGRYHPEAIVLHEGGSVTGGDAILALFTEVTAVPRRVVTATVVSRTEDTLLYDVVQEVDGETVRIVGSYVLRDALIWRHVSLGVPLDG